MIISQWDMKWISLFFPDVHCNPTVDPATYTLSVFDACKLMISLQVWKIRFADLYPPDSMLYKDANEFSQRLNAWFDSINVEID
jgi:hypothetical protein